MWDEETAQGNTTWSVVLNVLPVGRVEGCGSTEEELLLGKSRSPCGGGYVLKG